MADEVYTYVTETGTIVPDAEVIRQQVQDEYITTFGDDLNLDPSTPQGMLITIETLSRIAVANNNALLANQINPNLAGGIFLDALLALLGAARTEATFSIVFCDLTGIEGTSIPVGAQISDQAGENFYQLVMTTVIPVGGSITGVEFRSVLPGAIPGDAGSLTKIVSNILGWETVTNPANASMGQNTQSDVSARQFRLNTLASQSVSQSGSVIAKLTATSGVTSVFYQENNTSSPATINSIPMVANSMYVCVGGNATAQDIGSALTASKAGGCAYNNGLGIPQSVVITDPFSLQAITVLYDIPATVLVAINVTVHALSTIQDLQSAVRQAIVDYAAGLIPGNKGLTVGTNVSPFQIAGAINVLVPGAFVDEVEVALYSFTQIGTITASDVNVTGLTYNSAITPTATMGISGVGIPSSTTVSTLTGGTGLVMSNAATESATEILTFNPLSLSYQTTELAIGVFQQAIVNPNLINVSTS